MSNKIGKGVQIGNVTSHIKRQHAQKFIFQRYMG